MSNRTKQKMLILLISLNILSVHYVLSYSIFMDFFGPSLLTIFFFLSQHSRPDFLEIPYSTICLSGVRTTDTKILSCPLPDISSQMYEIFLDLKFLIATSFYAFLSDSY